MQNWKLCKTSNSIISKLVFWSLVTNVLSRRLCSSYSLETLVEKIILCKYTTFNFIIYIIYLVGINSFRILFLSSPPEIFAFKSFDKVNYRRGINQTLHFHLLSEWKERLILLPFMHPASSWLGWRKPVGDFIWLNGNSMDLYMAECL